MNDNWDAPSEGPPKAKGRRGTRPPGRFDPNIDWALAERLYIEGELKGEAEHVRRIYPSHADIARRTGTSTSNLGQRVWRYNWREKKTQFQRDHAVIENIPQAKDKLVVEVMPPRPLRRDPETILRAYIDLFAEAVEKKTIRYDCIADLDKAIRLLAYVRGQAESTKHVHVSVSLEAMQARHRALRQLVASRVDDDVAGVIGAGEPLAALSEVQASENDEGEAWDA